IANTSRQLKLSDNHELLYFVDTRLAGGDPHAIFGVLHEHLGFLSNLAAEGKLVFPAPWDTLTGATPQRRQSHRARKPLAPQEGLVRSARPARFSGVIKVVETDRACCWTPSWFRR